MKNGGEGKTSLVLRKLVIFVTVMIFGLVKLHDLFCLSIMKNLFQADNNQRSAN